MENNYLELAHIIYINRLKLGLSRNKLAQLIDISSTELKRIEEGKRISPNIVTLIKICEILNLDFIKVLVHTGYLDISYLEKKQENNSRKYEILFKKNGDKIYIIDAENEDEAINYILEYLDNQQNNFKKKTDYKIKKVEKYPDDFLSDSLEYTDKIMCPFYSQCNLE